MIENNKNFIYKNLISVRGNSIDVLIFKPLSGKAEIISWPILYPQIRKRKADKDWQLKYLYHKAYSIEFSPHTQVF